MDVLIDSVRPVRRVLVPTKYTAGCGIWQAVRTDHPKMAMVAMAWTHPFKNARVLCLQPGHNNDSYADPNFRTVLSRGIQWAAGRL